MLKRFLESKWLAVFLKFLSFGMALAAFAGLRAHYAATREPSLVGVLGIVAAALVSWRGLHVELERLEKYRFDDEVILWPKRIRGFGRRFIMSMVLWPLVLAVVVMEVVALWPGGLPSVFHLGGGWGVAVLGLLTLTAYLSSRHPVSAVQDVVDLFRWRAQAIKAYEWHQERQGRLPEQLEDEDTDAVRGDLNYWLQVHQELENYRSNLEWHPFNEEEGRQRLAECMVLQFSEHVPAFADEPAGLAEVFRQYREWRMQLSKLAKAVERERTLVAMGEKKPVRRRLPYPDLAYEAVRWYRRNEGRLRDPASWEKHVRDNMGLYVPYERLLEAQRQYARHPLKNETTLERFAWDVMKADPKILGDGAQADELIRILRRWRDDQLECCERAREVKEQAWLRQEKEPDSQNKLEEEIQRLMEFCHKGFQADADQLGRAGAMSKWDATWQGKMRNINLRLRKLGVPVDGEIEPLEGVLVRYEDVVGEEA